MFKRRRSTRPPPIDASSEADPAIELEVRVQPGAELGALKELRELGADGQVVDRGELRLTTMGPLRPIIAAEQALALYAVKRIGDVEPDADIAVRAALDLAGVVAALQRGKLASYRVTGDGSVSPASLGRLGQFIGSRLGIAPAIVQPELILIARHARDGALELAARLPRSSARPRPSGAVAPPAPSSRRPRREARR